MHDDVGAALGSVGLALAAIVRRRQERARPAQERTLIAASLPFVPLLAYCRLLGNT